MANEEQLAILKQGVEVWNEWRRKNQGVLVDLRKANLQNVDLRKANLRDAVLRRADLRTARLWDADLKRADLWKADLWRADFWDATLEDATLTSTNLMGANLFGVHLKNSVLRRANLTGADLTEADLAQADLTGANISGAQLVRTQLPRANISNCRVFGVSAWKLNLEGTIQSNLIITPYGEPVITVDNLEIAQFIYLLIHNEKLRDVIDTIGKKAVLILGRFTDERLAVLEAIREELRQRDYIPILFDFEKPNSRDITETVGLLAHMARFVIADLTDAKSIPQELSHIVPDLPSVAVQPLILSGQREYGMFEHFQRYPWVLPIHEYESQDQLIAELSEKVIAPAEAKVDELRPAK